MLGQSPSRSAAVMKNMLGGAATGAIVDPILGTAAGAMGGALKTFYQGRVDRAVADMMLDPRKFAAWTSKAGATSNEATMARRMRALLGQEAAQGIDMETNPR